MTAKSPAVPWRTWAGVALLAWTARCGPPAGGPPTGPAGAGRRDTLVAAPVAPGAGATPQPPASAMRPLPASARLFTSDQSQAGEPGVRVLRDRAAWEAEWRALHAGLAAGPAPAVDFAREMVAVVALGQRTSGGYAVRVEGVSDAPGGAVLLHVTETAPGEGCMTASVMTAPVDVVRLPRADGEVRAQTRRVAQPC